MKLKELSKKSIALLIILVIFASVGVYKTGYSIGKSIGKNLKIDNQITQVLKDECDCKEVNQIIYAKGLQYSKDEGLTTEKVEYQLIDCSYTTIEDQGKKINEALLKEVEDFKEFDLITLEFLNGTNKEKVIIKNGIIQ